MTWAFGLVNPDSDYRDYVNLRMLHVRSVLIQRQDYDGKYCFMSVHRSLFRSQHQSFFRHKISLIELTKLGVVLKGNTYGESAFLSVIRIVQGQRD